MGHLDVFLEAMKADAAVIHRPENMRWLAGYTGEGCLFVSRNIRAIVTDFRYVHQAELQSPDWRVCRTLSQRPAETILCELAGQCRARRIQVETDYLTHDGFLTLANALDGVSLTPMEVSLEGLRQVKDADEVENIRSAAAIACQAFENLLPKLHVGMTERQVQILLDFEMLSLGSEGAAFNTIAAAGENGALPHATPSDHVIAGGELLTLDFGATVKGYRSDMTRTIGFGKIGPTLRAVYDVVLKAQTLALAAIAPGKTCGEIDAVARDFIEAHYPGAFGHSLGHGVGLYIHEQPRVSPGNAVRLMPGHVITVEPGVYIPGLGGCRIEDMAIMTSDGYVNPITAPKQLIEL